MKIQTGATANNSRVRFDPVKGSHGARLIFGSDRPGIQVRLTWNLSRKYTTQNKIKGT